MKHLFPNKTKLFDGQKTPWMIAEIQTLTVSSPMYPFDPPESIRKRLVF